MGFIGDDLTESKGQTIKKITSYDAAGYDKGFILEFVNGLTLTFKPEGYAINNSVAHRIDIKKEKGEMKYCVKYKRQYTYPCSILEETDDNEIYEIWVGEEETFMKDHVRYYKMVIGHGQSVDLPIIMNDYDKCNNTGL